MVMGYDKNKQGWRSGQKLQKEILRYTMLVHKGSKSFNLKKKNKETG